MFSNVLKPKKKKKNHKYIMYYTVLWSTKYYIIILFCLLFYHINFIKRYKVYLVKVIKISIITYYDKNVNNFIIINIISN